MLSPGVGLDPVSGGAQAAMQADTPTITQRFNTFICSPLSPLVAQVNHPLR